MSFLAECVNLPIPNRRRGARAGGITHRVRTIVFVLPEDFAVAFVETKHAFRAGNFTASERIGWIARALGEPAIYQVNAATRHRRSGVSRANRRDGENHQN